MLKSHKRRLALEHHAQFTAIGLAGHIVRVQVRACIWLKPSSLAKGFYSLLPKGVQNRFIWVSFKPKKDLNLEHEHVQTVDLEEHLWIEPWVKQNHALQIEFGMVTTQPQQFQKTLIPIIILKTIHYRWCLMARRTLFGILHGRFQDTRS